MNGLLVVVGGALGAAVRFEVGTRIQRRADTEMPVGTAVVNAAGSLLLGLVVGLGLAGDALAVTAGVLAGLTTYSTWMVESVALAAEGLRARAVVNLTGMLTAGLALAWIGLMVGRAVT
jgi:CrcB protein